MESTEQVTDGQPPEAADRLVAETEAAQRAERSEFLATRASALESLAVYLMRR